LDLLKRRGTRALVISAVALLAAVGETAQAAHSPENVPPWTPPGLLDNGRANPQQSFRVIISGVRGVSSDDVAAVAHGRLGRVFSSINGIVTTIDGAQLLALAHNPNILSIVPDAPVVSAGLEEAALWRPAIGATRVPSLVGWGKLPAIAIVDSGVDSTRTQDFGSRVVASVNLNSDNPNATGDAEGHGTMVAGIAAGASPSYPGVVPTAPIVSVGTADANGASHMSDVIAACDWILKNQSAYNIRVANLSLVSEAQSSFVNDPLDAAVEKLWFHGVVVVAAAGNFGQPGGVSMTHAPGNDPFVITVGALDTNGTLGTADDVAAPWSAYGHTGDGFRKPDISAPGRWIVAPVPLDATLPAAAPARIVSPGYMWMSGTSLSAPMVSGAADAVLGLHPGWTPGQVKSALMQTASPLPAIGDGAGGAGELNAAQALRLSGPSDADAVLERFVGGSGFDGAAWEQGATDWSATDWSATDWSATDWSATDWSATDWSATDWSATAWLP
jgi:serine protease AprX